uniref:Sodium/hydrogen exchanger n=1 Tax=Romanomermis culicivorax TaxID=13658 RepID=A0A915IJZ4_ROMCU
MIDDNLSRTDQIWTYLRKDDGFSKILPTHGRHDDGQKRLDSGLKVADWNYENVQEPLILTFCIIAISIFKLCNMLIMVGLVIGFLFYVENADNQLKFLLFDSHAFFLFLLPPIILESAYSLRDRAFLESIATILLYAVIGTVLNIVIIGPLLFLVCYFGFAQLNLIECMIFASLISAVDPVAVLAIFQELGVNKMLYFMVFGESLFNDAVTVVTYNMFAAFQRVESVGLKEISLGCASFVCVALGGIIIGSISGLITAFLTKYTTKTRVVEPILFFGMSYLSYLLAELVKFSGIISIICCGIVQSHYAVENISSKSYISIHYFSKVASAVAESLIFIILGVALISHSSIWKQFNAIFAFWALFLCIITRFAVVFFLTHFVNRFFLGMRRVTRDEQLIVAYGGLRGAITFSLAFMFVIDTTDRDKVMVKNIMLTSSYVVILFTVFVQGITLKPLVKLIRIQLQAKDTSLTREINRARKKQEKCAINSHGLLAALVLFIVLSLERQHFL